MPGGWEVLGLPGDPAPGDPGQVRGLAGRLLEEARLAEDNTAKLSAVSGNSSALRMRGDYAAPYAEALGELPGELAKLGKAYRGAGNALMTYAGSLEQARAQAGAALRQGRTADTQYQGALREVRAQLPGAGGVRSLAEAEAAVRAAEPAVRAAVRPAVERARNAEADRARARRIADEATRLRGDAESRAVREIEQALDGSGIRNKSFLQQAWDVISTPFRSWDDFVAFAGKVALVAGLVVLVIGTGGLAGAILAGVAVAAGAVVLGDALNKYRQGRGSLGEVGLAALGIIPGGKSLGLLAQGAKAVGRLRGAAAAVRAGGGTLLGSAAKIPAGAMSIRSAIQAGGTHAGAAAAAAWQRGRQFFSKDPVHFPTGIVLLAQTDVDLPGVLPLRLERTHLSNHRTGRWFGRSWASTLDQRIEVDAEGVCLATATGTLLSFPHPEPDRSAHPDDGPRLALRPAGDGYTVSDPHTGHTTHFARQDGDVLPIAAITGRNGDRVDFHYTDGLLTEVTHSGGYHLDIETHQGRVVEIRLRGAGQTVVSYAYDESGDLTEVTNSSGLPLRFTYDDEGRMTRWQDRIGTWYAYTYDQEGRCVYGTGTDGIFNTEISYGEGVTTARDSLGHATTYHYNDRLQVVTESNPLGHVTRYRWDSQDRLLAHTDPLGGTTNYAYDDAGALLSIIRPDGTERRLTRNALHLPETVTDYDGAAWTLAYDARGNLTSDPAATYAYDDRGHLTSITDALGHTRTIENDAAGLPIAITDPLGATTRYDRDPFGRVTAVTDPLGNTTRFAWTVEGEPAARTLPTGATERWIYDAENNLIEHVDALGQSTRTEIGPFDLPISQTTPDGARLEFAYDTELRLTTVTNPQGLTWQYTYDPAGNLTTETDFNRRVLTYVHDAAGNVTERVNGAGQSTTFLYDVLGQLIVQHSGDRVATFAYDELGRLVRAANPDAVLGITRDALGRITAETCNGRAVTSAYDALGRRTHRRTPSGAETRWDYDAGNRPLAVHTAGQTIHFDYDPAGREISRNFGTDVWLTHRWDPDSRLQTQTLAKGPGGPVIQSRAYGYRADGYVTKIDDLLSGRRRFELDSLGRATGVRGSNWSEQYTYNTSGQVTDALWPTLEDSHGPRAYTGTMIRQAGRTRYEYDRQGRMVLRQKKGLSSKPRTWHYSWDADDRLIGVVTPDGTAWRYLYDPLGRRIAKERVGGTGRVDFAWDGLTLAEQTSGDRTTTWDWEPGTFRPLSQTERRAVSQEEIDERFYAIATDLIGTPAELVDPDGELAWRSRQSFWGASAQPGATSLECSLRFPGQYADEESGLHYNLFRHYDPDSGHYSAADPIGLTGGWNPHAYVRNATTWSDPLGLAACSTGTPKGLTAGTPPSVVRNGLQPHELVQAREIVDFRGGRFVGASPSQPGIDGWLDGAPVSLKAYSGTSPAGVLRHASLAESSASKAGFSGVDLYVDAKNVPGATMIDFGVNGPLAQIPRQGTISSIYVNSADGWIVFPG
ncbi:RHS repeat-associated core domain-containing protein [Nonomuraea sp. NPDC049480]|uniref:RHS repeat-associated core domain-containing protein n=1 Tax=Nonomuraea sp. NPDC049480 TaxID=3364353 RepID=UPI00379AAF26